MFDIGFSELIVIGLVALVVIGPERLPRVARTVGHLLGRLQRYVSDVKSDIQREMQIEDLKKLQQQVAESARELESSMRNQVGAVGADIGKAAAAATAALAVDSAARSVSSPEAEAAQVTQEVASDMPPEQAALAGPPAVGETSESAPAETEPSPQLELGLEPGPASQTDKPA